MLIAIVAIAVFVTLRLLPSEQTNQDPVKSYVESIGYAFELTDNCDSETKTIYPYAVHTESAT